MSETDFQMPANVIVGEQKRDAVPRFYIEPQEMTFKSKQEGRPIFENREMVEILIPGDRNSRAVEIVNDEHRGRWPQEYAAFKRGEAVPLVGTPLREWPVLKAGRVLELAYFNILTVEQLAAVNDVQLQNLGMGAREIREQARKFLEVARDGTGPLLRLMERAVTAEAEVARLREALAVSSTEIERLRSLNHAGA